MKKNLKKNLLIFIRHGERSDKVTGIIPTFNKWDPELTLNGKRQALDIGSILSDYLLEKYPNFKNLKIITSPFARTIQTSKNVLKGLSNKLAFENNLEINYYFSEYIKEVYPTFDFPSFLVVKNEFHKLLPDLENTDLSYMNNADEVISKQFENDKLCEERILKGLKNLFSVLQKEKEETVYVVVSHGDPINFANIELGYPGPIGWRNIQYCNSFVYEVDFTEDKSGVIKSKVKYIDQLIPAQK